MVPSWVLFLLAGLSLLYFGAVCAKNAAMFPSFMVKPPEWYDLPPGSERLALDNGCEAFFLAGKGVSAGSPGPLVVLTHGNAETVHSLFDDMKRYYAMGVSSLALEYRGYGNSKGSSCPKNVRRDSLEFVNMVGSRPEVDMDRLILYGRSIGGGVVCDVATDLRPAALILQSTFTSVKELVHTLAPVVSWLIPTSEYDTLGYVSANPDTPLLLIHGKNDTIVPVDHAFGIRRASRKCTFVAKQCEHNDMPPCWDEIYKFLKKESLLGFEP